MPDVRQPSIRYVHHHLDGGLTRFRADGRLGYLAADGTPVDDPDTLERIARLAIPPAWRDVWIAEDADAHLQATGIDAKGRRQYRYHRAWRQDREKLKYIDMMDFARRQPALRRRTSELLAADGLDAQRVHALSLRLLDVGLFRIGSERSRRDAEHYGLTTLRREALTLDGGVAHFDYTGKAGVRQHIVVDDPEAVRALAQLAERRTAGDQLLAFQAGDDWRAVHREDVNNFLRVLADGPFSAKEFRTWNATVIAARELADRRPAPSRAAATAARAASAALGNTPTVARQSYIDPRVLERYAEGRVVSLERLGADASTARRRLERRVLDLLTAPGV